MFEFKTIIPDRVKVPTSILGESGQSGTVVAVWYNTVKVRWDDGKLGIYTGNRHVFLQGDPIPVDQ